jgi:hypothetical protein
MNICNYCKKNKKLIQAHIVPKGFLGMLEQQKFLEVSFNYSYKKRMPIGPYDMNILCADCDKIIGLYDEYAKKILIEDIHLYKNKNLPIYSIPAHAIDYLKLKKFFISLIWRASISSRDAFKEVSLGYYNDVALACLKDERFLEDNIFAILVFKDGPNIKYQDAITFTASKLAEKHAYKIHFSGYQITIVPKSTDMRWVVEKGDESPQVLFLKKENDWTILELDQDISGKQNILDAYKESFRVK